MKQLGQKETPLSQSHTLKAETPIWIVRPDNTITESHLCGPMKLLEVCLKI